MSFTKGGPLIVTEGHSIALEQIAVTADSPEISPIRQPAKRLRHDMLNFQRGAGDLLAGCTSTPLACMDQGLEQNTILNGGPAVAHSPEYSVV